MTKEPEPFNLETGGEEREAIYNWMRREHNQSDYMRELRQKSYMDRLRFANFSFPCLSRNLGWDQRESAIQAFIGPFPA